ncbi:MAG: hypothetical protein IJL85_03375 [Erysipelotrichaceae bacterium]|nr:hypothetical protein [Erysipelotrichaceae bacterium]
MKKQIKILTVLALIAVLCCACNLWGDGGNKPYEPDTPAPDPHNGTFVSEHGTMTFNGDGKSVIISFDEELSKLTSLPSGEQAGTYVFLSGDLPPNGSVDVRYDVAHELQIAIGEETVVLNVGIASEDGSTATVGVDMVTPDRIPLLFREDNRNFSIIFEKEH